MPNFKFPKHQRIKKKKYFIDLLNSENKVLKYPLLFKWLFISDPNIKNLQAAIIVSKKRIPKAIYRNKIRRKIKEAFRLNKYILEQKIKDSDKKLLISIIYLSNKTNIKFSDLNNIIKSFLETNNFNNIKNETYT